MNQPFELFLLLLNLSQLSNREQVIKTFIEAMADIFHQADVRFAAESVQFDERVFPIKTLKREHGYIVCSEEIDKCSPVERALLRTAVSMLGVIIEKIEQEQLLSDEKLELDVLVLKRSQELLEKNISLEKLNEKLNREMDCRKAAERDLDLFFRLSSGLLCIARLDGYFKKLNPAWTQTLGWTENELKSVPWVDFVHPEDMESTIEAGQTLKKGGIVRSFENRYRAKNNEYRWLKWSAFPKVDEGLIFAVVLDVTETKLLEEKLRQSEKMQAVGQLAGGIAHDFNNQLGGILGFAELLSEQLEGNSVLCGYVENIITGARRSADLTHQLLTFARKSVYQPESIAVHEMLNEVVTLLRHTVDKRIELVSDYSEQELMINGVYSQLQNAVLNLALNARDALDNRSNAQIRISTEIVHVDDSFRVAHSIDVRDGDYAAVSIEDNGTGMPPEVISRALEPFFTTKEAGKGTGMGLSVVYGTIRHHQGDLAISSIPNQGSVIRLFLPVLGPRTAKASGSTTADRVEYGLGKADSSYRLLLVDDEPMIQEMSSAMLKSLGYTVTVCSNGREAVSYYKDHVASVDAVILDMIMPEMDGSETFQLLKEINSDVRVILASGYSEESLAERLLTEGASGFLQKPFRKRSLAEMLAEVLK